MSDSTFSRRTIIAITAVAGVSFAAALLLAVFGDELGGVSSVGPNSYSRSALGHRGFIQLLRKLDVPTIVSTHDTATKATGAATLIVAEPLIVDDGGEGHLALRDLLEEPERVLIVLPKWYGIEDPLHRDWVEQVAMLDLDEVSPILDLIGIQGEVVRPSSEQRWQTDELAGTPELATPQLVDATNLTPLIWCESGILLGELWRGEQKIWLLSDPDLLSNHGLGRGDNAMLALGAVNQLRRHTGAVVFDETLHGFRTEPTLWKALFEFPLALATLTVLIAVAMLLWAALGRFGAPVRRGPAIEPGKQFLIGNTAELLRFGGHAGHTLRRYLQITVRDVAQALHAPSRLTSSGVRDWLIQLGKRRELTHTLAEIERAVNDAATASSGRSRAVAQAAVHVYQWKQEMTHGLADSTRN